MVTIILTYLFSKYIEQTDPVTCLYAQNEQRAINSDLYIYFLGLYYARWTGPAHMRTSSCGGGTLRMCNSFRAELVPHVFTFLAVNILTPRYRDQSQLTYRFCGEDVPQKRSFHPYCGEVCARNTAYCWVRNLQFTIHAWHMHLS